MIHYSMACIDISSLSISSGYPYSSASSFDAEARDALDWDEFDEVPQDVEAAGASDFLEAYLLNLVRQQTDAVSHLHVSRLSHFKGGSCSMVLVRFSQVSRIIPV